MRVPGRNASALLGRGGYLVQREGRFESEWTIDDMDASSGQSQIDCGTGTDLPANHSPIQRRRGAVLLPRGPASQDCGPHAHTSIDRSIDREGAVGEFEGLLLILLFLSKAGGSFVFGPAQEEQQEGAPLLEMFWEMSSFTTKIISPGRDRLSRETPKAGSGGCNRARRGGTSDRREARGETWRT